MSKHIFINEIREKGNNFKTQTRKQSQNIGLITFKLKKKKITPTTKKTNEYFGKTYYAE